MLAGFEAFTGTIGMFMAGGALTSLFMGGAFPVVRFFVGVGLIAAFYFHEMSSSRLWKAVCRILAVGIMIFAVLYWKDTLLNVAGNVARAVAACCRFVFRMIFAALCI